MPVKDAATGRAGSQAGANARKESEEKIVAQLDRVLSSKAFRQADRFKRFLTFTVNETIAGRSEQLKEFVIWVEVFDKGPSFDPRSGGAHAAWPPEPRFYEDHRRGPAR